MEFLLNTATAAQIAEHLARCDNYFNPPLSTRVQLPAYARKIVSHAARFEAWSGGEVVGLVAAYCNDQVSRQGYITSVSVLPAWSGHGIGSRLIAQCLEHAQNLGMQQISLEVAHDDSRAIALYTKSGFALGKASKARFVLMTLRLQAPASKP